MKNSLLFDDATIELGKKILAQFGRDESCGILTSWMSHHVAELITRAESEKGTPAEQEIRSACVETILKLWAHRNSLPNGSRPFEAAERAAQTLVRLAPESGQDFYFTRHVQTEQGSNENSVYSAVWLDFAEAFDKAARELIRVCMSQSLGASAVGLSGWLQAAYELEDDPAVDIQVIKGLLESASDQELDEIANSDTSRNARVVAQLDKIIKSLTSMRDSIAQTDDDTTSNISIER